MHPPEPHQRDHRLASYRESRKKFVTLVASLPLGISSFVGLVANCSTGVWSRPPSSDTLSEVLVSLGAVTRVASAAGLLVLLIAMLRLASLWWRGYWQRMERRKERRL